MTLRVNDSIRPNMRTVPEQTTVETNKSEIELFPTEDNNVPKSVAEAQHRLDSLNQVSKEQEAERLRIEKSEKAKKKLPKAEANLKKMEKQLEIYKSDLENNTHIGLANKVRDDSMFEGKFMVGVLFGVPLSGGAAYAVGDMLADRVRSGWKTTLGAIGTFILAEVIAQGIGHITGRCLSKKRIKALDNPNNRECLEYHANLLKLIKNKEYEIEMEKHRIMELQRTIID